MIRACLLDFRLLAPSIANVAAEAAVTLSDRLAVATAWSGSRIPEWAQLSTCHRCEVYVHGVGEGWLLGLLREHFPETVSSGLIEVSDDRAAHHLKRVAAGLDSMLLGETDVQGQVGAALVRAMENGTVGPVLNSLFEAALHAGKRVRTLTDIGRNASSLASAAVDLVVARLGHVERASVLVLGAGKMARRACERLDGVGIKALTVTNRTLARAESLAALHGAQATPWAEIVKVMREADLAISATSAPEPFINGQLMSRAMKGRAGRPLHIVDLALPENVHPEVSGIEDVFHYNLRDLEEAVRASQEARASQIPQAEAIIDQEVTRFVSWLRQHGVAPSLRLLGELARSSRDAELDRMLRRLPELTTRQRRVVQSLANNLAHRLVRWPMLRLRDAAGSDREVLLREAVEHLFKELDTNGTD